jgi:hypothetical protein
MVATENIARTLLGDTGKPVLPTFAAIGEALGCTPISAQTVTWQLTAQHADVHPPGMPNISPAGPSRRWGWTAGRSRPHWRTYMPTAEGCRAAANVALTLLPP